MNKTLKNKIKIVFFMLFFAFVFVIFSNVKTVFAAGEYKTKDQLQSEITSLPLNEKIKKIFMNEYDYTNNFYYKAMDFGRKQNYLKLRNAFILSLESSFTIVPKDGSYVYEVSLGSDTFVGIDGNLNSARDAAFLFLEIHKELFMFTGNISYGSKSVAFTVYDDYYANNQLKLKEDIDYFYINFNYLKSIAYHLSPYEKALYFHDWLVYHNQYNNEALDPSPANQARFEVKISHTPISALKEDYSPVCEGYAELYYLLLNSLGVETIYVVGIANGGPHAWNYVKLDSKYYFVDVTWNDPATVGGVPELEYIGYKNFLISGSSEHINETKYPFIEEKPSDPNTRRVINITYPSLSSSNYHTTEKLLYYEKFTRPKPYLAGDISKVLTGYGSKGYVNIKIINAITGEIFKESLDGSLHSSEISNALPQSSGVYVFILTPKTGKYPESGHLSFSCEIRGDLSVTFESPELSSTNPIKFLMVGDEVNITVNIPANKQIDKFFIDGLEKTITGNTYKLIVSGNHVVKVTFKAEDAFKIILQKEMFLNGTDTIIKDINNVNLALESNFVLQEVPASKTLLELTVLIKETYDFSSLYDGYVFVNYKSSSDKEILGPNISKKLSEVFTEELATEQKEIRLKAFFRKVQISYKKPTTSENVTFDTNFISKLFNYDELLEGDKFPLSHPNKFMPFVGFKLDSNSPTFLDDNHKLYADKELYLVYERPTLNGPKLYTKLEEPNKIYLYATEESITLKTTDFVYDNFKVLSQPVYDKVSEKLTLNLKSKNYTKDYTITYNLEKVIAHQLHVVDEEGNNLYSSFMFSENPTASDLLNKVISLEDNNIISGYKINGVFVTSTTVINDGDIITLVKINLKDIIKKSEDVNFENGVLKYSHESITLLSKNDFKLASGYTLVGEPVKDKANNKVTLTIKSDNMQANQVITLNAEQGDITPDGPLTKDNKTLIIIGVCGLIGLILIIVVIVVVQKSKKRKRR